jgi:hypothetical protein
MPNKKSEKAGSVTFRPDKDIRFLVDRAIILGLSVSKLMNESARQVMPGLLLMRMQERATALEKMAGEIPGDKAIKSELERSLRQIKRKLPKIRFADEAPDRPEDHG